MISNFYPPKIPQIKDDVKLFLQKYTNFLLTFYVQYIILITEKVDKTNFIEIRSALWENLL